VAAEQEDRLQSRLGCVSIREVVIAAAAVVMVVMLGDTVPDTLWHHYYGVPA
jgi:hypothetical protein